MEVKTPHFQQSEFACACCGLDCIDPMFVWSLEHSRISVGIPYVVTSGVRCDKHNKDVGGAATSAHVPREIDYPLVKCSDIRCDNMYDRKRMLQDMSKRFRHIGIAKTFIHVDDDPSKPEGIYLY